MDINFHAHHAVISERLRIRASRTMDRYSERYPFTVDATVRFEQDGPSRRVEIVVHGRRSRRWIAEGRGRSYGPALTAALKHLESQLAHGKRTVKDRAQSAPRA
ncbi:MAG: HPF/RaiA family ribosome-associated protein [Gemmatimonadaceae bacterium]